MINKKKITMLVAITLSLVLSIVVATYAYFSATITGNLDASSVIAKSAQLGLVYEDGNEINETGIIPGWTANKTFTVTNTGESLLNYNIIWKELLNEIQNNDLIYSITGTTTSFAETAMPTSAGTILESISILPGETHEYTMTLTFLNREYDQGINQGKTFAGKIEINTEIIREKSTLVESVAVVNPEVSMENDYFLSGPLLRSQIEELEFVSHKNIPVTAQGNWDVSNYQEDNIIAWYEPVGVNGRYKVTVGSSGGVKADSDSKGLFMDLRNLNSLNFNDVFDTSNVYNMNYMFLRTGYNSTEFTLDLGNNFDTSSVIVTFGMFFATGYSSPVFTLDLGPNFDTSNAVYLEAMFMQTGYSSQVFTLDLGDKFDTSRATSSRTMFYQTGYSSPVFTLDLGPNFNTKSVKNMRAMFFGTGASNSNFTLNLGEKYDTSKVTDMSNLFTGVGHLNSSFNLNLGPHFNMSKVTNFDSMFYLTGNANPNFNIYAPNETIESIILNERTVTKLKESTTIVNCATSELC